MNPRPHAPSQRLPDDVQARADFVAEALAARVQAITTGGACDAAEVRAWLRARVAGKPAPMPRAKPWRV